MNAAWVLPAREQGFAAYPQREAHGSGDAPKRAGRARRSPSSIVALPGDVAAAFERAEQRLASMSMDQVKQALPSLRARVRAGQSDEPHQCFLSSEAAGLALALAAWSCHHHVGLRPYATQVLAAWLMLDGHLAEVATGEGKTVAVALAAAAAALSGAPVHVMTANDYLVQRDHDRMAVLYDGLTLTHAVVLPRMTRAERLQAYRSDITVVTAREVAFDYLRDHLALRGERHPQSLQVQAMRAAAAHDDRVPNPQRVDAFTPVLPGLCLALIDEADSILLDEATVPLLLAAPVDAVEVQTYQRALVIAATLRRGRDYHLSDRRRCALLAPGRQAVQDAVQSLATQGADVGLLRPLRRAQELVACALTAQHAMQRGRDYVVSAGAGAALKPSVHLVDEVTGRVAEGRQWSGPLQAMVELKEGLPPSPGTRVSAQITYQRFLPRYLRLGGMSGTLVEAQRELQACYGTPVRRVPLVQPDRRQWLGEMIFETTVERDAAVIERVKSLIELGRPVLVGTDSVVASQRLADALTMALASTVARVQLLNASQDAHEATCVARAGCSAVVTVATNMAGRGTDIALSNRARHAGGLHVIRTVCNRSPRIDRQLVGRAARHGDPGSAEALLSLEDDFFVEHARSRLSAFRLELLRRFTSQRAPTRSWWTAYLQRQTQAHDASVRRRLARNERELEAQFAFAGGVE
jgi:preprotein translocase subunit SecA